jgi:hypothetical protein
VNLVIYGAIAAALALGSLAACWAILNALWHRHWKFAAGAAFIATLMAGGAFEMWNCGQGRCVKEDPSVPRYR